MLKNLQDIGNNTPQASTVERRNAHTAGFFMPGKNESANTSFGRRALPNLANPGRSTSRRVKKKAGALKAQPSLVPFALSRSRLVDRAMLREEPAPDLQKDVGAAPRPECRDERALAQAHDGAEEDQTQDHRHHDEEDVHAHSERPERPAPAVHDGEHQALGRKNEQARIDHARNAEARQHGARHNLKNAHRVARGIKKGGHPHGTVEHEAEERADRQLLDGLHEKVATIDDRLQHEEKGVGGKDEKAHRKSRALRQDDCSRAHRAGAQSCMRDGRNSGCKHTKPKEKHHEAKKHGAILTEKNQINKYRNNRRRQPIPQKLTT